MWCIQQLRKTHPVSLIALGYACDIHRNHIIWLTFDLVHVQGCMNPNQSLEVNMIEYSCKSCSVMCCRNKYYSSLSLTLLTLFLATTVTNSFHWNSSNRVTVTGLSVLFCCHLCYILSMFVGNSDQRLLYDIMCATHAHPSDSACTNKVTSQLVRLRRDRISAFMIHLKKKCVVLCFKG